jgi:carboxyl-terminal processing protease
MTRKMIFYFFCVFFLIGGTPTIGGLKDQFLEKDLEDMMAINSVLSLIRNYYVDPSDVTEKKLLQKTLDALKTVYPVFYREDRSRLEVSFDGETFYFPALSTITYQDILESFFILGRYVDRYKEKGAVFGGIPSKKEGVYEVLNLLNLSLDAHSSILSVEEFQELKQGTEGVFGGVGVLVGMENGILTVIEAMDHSPAQAAGIQKNDKIIEIDGKSTYGLALGELVDFMKGLPDSKVNLSILRQNDFAPREISLKRELIQVSSLSVKEIPYEDVVYFYGSIDSFSQKTADELRLALENFKKKHGALSGVLLDLRSNPGGLLDQAVRVADLFIDAGVLVSTKGRYEEVEVAQDSWRDTSYPVVVLINGDSASASEIVAGTLQDHKRALLVGEPSFGKGSVQTLFELPGERALKLTIARYYTPLGRSIQNVGIMPHVWLQPVWAAIEKNQNILGYDRYKNEWFLDHALSNKKNKKNIWDRPLYKGYYLATKDQKPLLEKQPEVKLGLEYLRHGVHALKKMVSDWDIGALEYINKKFLLDWSFGKEQKDSNLWVKFFPPEEKIFSSGDILSIPYEIKNDGDQDIYRASLFMRGKEGFGTVETLLGRLSAHGISKGVLSYPVNQFYPSPEMIQIDLGVAIDGIPYPTQGDKKFAFSVKKESGPDFEISFFFDDGSKTQSVLEPRTSGYLNITIEAKNKKDAMRLHQLEFSIENLSGRQIGLASYTQGSPKNDRLKIRVPIQGGEIVSSEVRFGVSLKEDGWAVMRKSFSLKSRPVGLKKSGLSLGDGP